LSQPAPQLASLVDAAAREALTNATSLLDEVAHTRRLGELDTDNRHRRCSSVFELTFVTERLACADQLGGSMLA
jgi:hypothetical protein